MIGRLIRTFVRNNSSCSKQLFFFVWETHLLFSLWNRAYVRRRRRLLRANTIVKIYCHVSRYVSERITLPDCSHAYLLHCPSFSFYQFIPIPMYCSYTYVMYSHLCNEIIPIYCTHTYVLIPMYSYLCTHNYVLIPMYSYLCLYTYILYSNLYLRTYTYVLMYCILYLSCAVGVYLLSGNRARW